MANIRIVYLLPPPFDTRRCRAARNISRTMPAPIINAISIQRCCTIGAGTASVTHCDSCWTRPQPSSLQSSLFRSRSALSDSRRWHPALYSAGDVAYLSAFCIFWSDCALHKSVIVLLPRSYAESIIHLNAGSFSLRVCLEEKEGREREKKCKIVNNQELIRLLARLLRSVSRAATFNKAAIH